MGFMFPSNLNLQFMLAKASGSMKQKAVAVRDDRITFMTQALHYLKFLKMFAWEKYYRRIIAGAVTCFLQSFHTFHPQKYN
jgi:hypothetical protein